MESVLASSGSGHQVSFPCRKTDLANPGGRLMEVICGREGEDAAVNSVQPALTWASTTRARRAVLHAVAILDAANAPELRGREVPPHVSSLSLTSTATHTNDRSTSHSSNHGWSLVSFHAWHPALTAAFQETSIGPLWALVV